MDIRLEQLNSHLRQGLQPVYLLSGDEPLQMQEASDAIRATAKQAGFEEREIFEVDAQFSWDQFLASGNELSLFAAKKVVELRLHNAKPGLAGAKALTAYLDNLSPDNLLLVTAPRLDKATQNSQWCKALTAAGNHVQIWPVTRQQLPSWIQARFKNYSLTAEREAVDLLADLVDGNLLAAAQEVEKLKHRLNDSTKVTVEIIRDAITDSARYSPFGLIDTALKGDAKQCVKMLRGLENEGIAANLILSGLVREIKQINLVAVEIARGQAPAQAMKKQGIWSNKQSLVGSALKRLSSTKLKRLTQELYQADRMLKGASPGSVWQQLEIVCLAIAGVWLFPSSD